MQVSFDPTEFNLSAEKLKQALAIYRVEKLMPHGLGQYLVTSEDKKIPWVSYRQDMAPAEALRVWQGMPLCRDMVVVSDTNYHYWDPEGVVIQHKSPVTLQGLGQARLTVDYDHKGRARTQVQLTFFAQLSDLIIEVHVRLSDPKVEKLYPRIEEKFGRGGCTVVERLFHMNEFIRGHSSTWHRYWVSNKLTESQQVYTIKDLPSFIGELSK